MLTEEEKLEKRRAYRRKWNEENRDKIRAQKKRWNALNKDKVKEHQRKYRERHPEKCYQGYSQEHYEKIKNWRKKYPERWKAYQRKWYKKNKKEHLANCKEYNKFYYQTNRTRILNYGRGYSHGKQGYPVNHRLTEPAYYKGWIAGRKKYEEGKDGK